MAGRGLMVGRVLKVGAGPGLVRRWGMVVPTCWNSSAASLVWSAGPSVEGP